MSPLPDKAELGPEGNGEKPKVGDRVPNMGEQLTGLQVAQLQQLVHEFGDVFTEKPGKAQGSRAQNY